MRKSLVANAASQVARMAGLCLVNHMLNMKVMVNVRKQVCIEALVLFSTTAALCETGVHDDNSVSECEGHKDLAYSWLMNTPSGRCIYVQSCHKLSMIFLLEHGEPI